MEIESKPDSEISNSHNTVHCRPIVGVIGSGEDQHLGLADGLGRLLADLGVHLLTGGGGGVMESVSRAFCQSHGRRGLAIGILPASEEEGVNQPKRGYPNRWVEIPITTHLPFSGKRGTDPMSRNHVNILSSHAVIALPGRSGTRSETRLAQRYHRPIIAYLGASGHIYGLSSRIKRAKDLGDVAQFLGENLKSPP